ncbi:fukutin [Caerostris extrusa]|uniref:Fukutin n=1 Tax=Caerostris extrusa TaxID=172846 RepID=A0AAV4XZZ0_CAEEX|nr:fukutin [Caerostris extrusa]
MLLKEFHYVPSYKTCIYDSSKEQDVGHYFYTRSKWTVHLVEFVNESNYLWHSALPNDSCPMLPNREKFHFLSKIKELLKSWYRECGIISYTTDVDFGMWAKDVQSVESLIQMFKSSESLKITTRFGFAEEALELSLNYKRFENRYIFFMLKEKSLCSLSLLVFVFVYEGLVSQIYTMLSRILSRKVLVPCETKKILLAEYGPDWAKPISKWNWKSSFSNKGPVIEWKESKRKDVYQFSNAEFLVPSDMLWNIK